MEDQDIVGTPLDIYNKICDGGTLVTNFCFQE
jgi:hypothetical protein